MTAYLRSGDHIHVAFWLDSRADRDTRLSQNKDMHAELVASYASAGVTVVASVGIASPDPFAPVVISVVRKPWTPRSAEKLKLVDD